MTAILCWGCHGARVVVVAVKDGYSIHKTCQTCYGKGTVG